ncbi:glycoside hydrolase family 38 C-terminal domain-containing protein [Streptomyces sp. MP131-18]|uniref:glycoside hydrolase family 38 N-terminal domain-containing protein n=1 Tax=Streptomyces sp. MP131-18 TaxID=1857892 RepID=UPI00097BA894|nr:glycoside hydrolase family 38 C-terminal domain-containing protein [Streptomyces sp. MP131-18]ONK09903.1 Alpha-mannosidase [Streptomyces sp. MP131-18]
MTTRALVRTTAWDNDRIRDSLRASVVSAEGTLGGVPVRLTQEPLLRRAAGGGLLQSLRVEAVGGAAPPARLTVRTASSGALPVEQLAGPNGSVRLLVPAVDAARRVTVTADGAADPSDGVEVELTPQRQWTIHLVHHSHLDIGYTDPQGHVLAEHLSFLDSCLELTGATDSWSEESKFRWCVESLLSFQQWADARPVEQVEEFVRRVREGRIELTAMPFNLHTETCSTDELHELLRPAREVANRFGVSFTSAMQTDVPGSVVGLVDALASAGVRYLSVAHNWAGRSVPHLVGGDKLPRLFRWRAPSGRSVLVWMTDTPHGLAYMEGPLLGFDTDYASVDDLLPAYLTSLANNPYPYEEGVFGWPMDREQISREPYPWDVLHLRVQGKFGDNAPPRRIIADTVRRWNETWAYPQLRLSRNEDFFTDAEARLGDRIQTFEGDWTDWWVDGVGSGAMPLSLARTAQGVVADAQTIGTFAGVLGAPGAEDDTRDAAGVYEAVSLFDEHTWGASDPWTHGHDHGHSGEDQWHWKYGQARRGHDDGQSLLNRAAARLGQRLARPAGAAAAFHVVNTCSWTRTEVARIFLPESSVPLEQPVAVLDARTGERLEHQEEGQVNDTHRDAGRFLVLRVTDVPPAGSVRLDVVATAGDGVGGDGAVPDSIMRRNPTGTTDRQDPAGTAERALARPDATVLENAHLRVRVDLARACIASIVDKASGAELVRQDAVVGFNGYLHDSYTTAGAFNHNSSRTTASDRLEHLGVRAVAPPAALIDRRSTAVAEILVYETHPAGANRVRTTLTLPHGIARLDVANSVDKDATLGKESAYFAFPFAFGSPRVRMEASGGATGSGLPVVPGSARHMRAVRRWVTLEEDGLTVAWSTQDAPLVQFGNIALPYAPFPATLEKDEPATVFSWIHNNLWDTNFPSQQGFEFPFRYSVACAPAERSAGLGPRTAAAFSRPLHAVRARGEAVADGAAAAALGFAEVGDARVRLVGAITPAGGRSVLLRLQSFAEEPVSCPVHVHFPVAAAHEADYLGTARGALPVEEGRVTVPVPALGTTAVLLERP